MNKTELITEISAKTNYKQADVKQILESFMETVMIEVENKGKVQLPGFGSFELRTRQERTGRNPITGEPMVIPAKSVPFFKPGKVFRETVL